MAFYCSNRFIAFVLASLVALTGAANDSFAKDLDFDGDGRDELALFDPSSGTFTIRFSSDLSFQEISLGAGATIPVPGQYNFPSDGKADLATFDSTTGVWRFNVLSDGTPVAPLVFGARGDFPVPADYDGNGCTDLAVYNPAGGVWTILTCGAPDVSKQVRWGNPGDIPVPADYDGDGRDDIAVFSRRDAKWRYLPSTGNPPVEIDYGHPGDIPAPANFLGTGVTDIAVYRPAENRLYVRGFFDFPHGLPGDMFTEVDVDGDNKTDLAVFRPSSNTWVVHTFTGFQFVIPWPARAAAPNTIAKPGMPLSTHQYPFGATPGDFDGDGRTDFTLINTQPGAVNKWFIQSIGSTLYSLDFGFPTDTLLAGDTDGDRSFEPSAVRGYPTGQVTWFVHRGNHQPIAVNWGLLGDTPLLGDFDCDGKDDLTQVRSEGGILRWFFRLSTGAEIYGDILGVSGDIAYAADVDSNGCDEMVVARKNFASGEILWYSKALSGLELQTSSWGMAVSDEPAAPADFDGDGGEDLVVIRNGGGLKTAFVRFARGGSATYDLGTHPVAYPGQFSGFNISEFAALAYAVSPLGHLYVVRYGGLVQDVPVFIPGGRNSLLLPSGTVGFVFDGFIPVAAAPVAAPAAPPVAPPPVAPPAAGGPGVEAVCAGIGGLGSGILWKAESDDSGGTREGRPALLFRRDAPGDGCLSVFAKNGQEIAKLGRYEASGKYGARYYAGWGCGDVKHGSEMARAAEAVAGSPEVYVEARSGSCIGPFNPSRRTGSL